MRFRRAVGCADCVDLADAGEGGGGGVSLALSVEDTGFAGDARLRPPRDDLLRPLPPPALLFCLLPPPPPPLLPPPRCPHAAELMMLKCNLLCERNACFEDEDNIEVGEADQGKGGKYHVGLKAWIQLRADQICN